MRFNADDFRENIDRKVISAYQLGFSTEDTSPAEKLTPAWHRLFQLSIDTHKLWEKKSIIIPAPKKACPREDNDLYKSPERLMIEQLRGYVEPLLDKYKFVIL